MPFSLGSGALSVAVPITYAPRNSEAAEILLPHVIQRYLSKSYLQLVYSLCQKFCRCVGGAQTSWVEKSVFARYINFKYVISTRQPEPLELSNPSQTLLRLAGSIVSDNPYNILDINSVLRYRSSLSHCHSAHDGIAGMLDVHDASAVEYPLDLWTERCTGFTIMAEVFHPRI